MWERVLAIREALSMCHLVCGSLSLQASLPATLGFSPFLSYLCLQGIALSMFQTPSGHHCLYGSLSALLVCFRALAAGKALGTHRLLILQVWSQRSLPSAVPVCLPHCSTLLIWLADSCHPSLWFLLGEPSRRQFHCH